MKKLFLSLLFIGFIGGEVARFTLFQSVSFRFIDIVAGCITLAWVIDMIRFPHKRLIWNTSVAKYIFAFLCIGVCSLLINLPHFSLPTIGEASLYLVRWFLYTGIFFYFQQLDAKEYTFSFTMLRAAGTILVLFGFIQYFYYNNLKNVYYLGWDDHMYRIFSVFLDPNFTGMVFVLFALLLMGTIWMRRKLASRYQLSFLLLLLLMTLIATVLTFSRSALISLLVGSLIFLSLIGKKQYFMYLIGVIGGMLLLAVPFFYIENVNLFRAASSEARFESAKNALIISKDHWLTGIGFNTYRYVQIQYGFRHGVGAEVSHADSGTDNSFLFVLATTGIIGLSIYILLLRSIGFYAWRIYVEKKSIYAAVFLASLGAVIVDSLFINSLFYPFILVWMWLLLSLTDASYT